MHHRNHPFQAQGSTERLEPKGSSSATAIPTDTRLQIRSGNNASAIFGVWLFSVFFAAIEGRSVFSTNETLAFAALGCSIVWPLSYFALSRRRFLPRVGQRQLIAIIIFSVFALLSATISPEMIKSTLYAVMTIFAILIAMQFNTNLNTTQYERGLTIYSSLMSVFLLWETYVNYKWSGIDRGGRLAFGDASLNPNAIALVGMSVLLSSMMIRNSIWRWTVFSAALFPIVMTRSRASALGALIGLAVIFIARTKAASRRTKVMVFLLLGLAAILGTIFSESVTGVSSDFFSIHDRHRGIDSGATGRIYAWKETWNLFVNNPVLGVGFRAHEYYLTVATSSHQGYLALLAEIGIFGFLSVMYLIGSGIQTLLRCVNNSELVYTHSVLLGLVLGYLFISFFERYLLNVGNPTSLLFLVAITIPRLSSRHALNAMPS
jgi:O-antigen ligase